MINDLITGMTIISKSVLTNFDVKTWKYAKECRNILTEIPAGASLEIVELSRIPGNIWIRAALPNTFPDQCLKISRDEYERWFKAA